MRAAFGVTVFAGVLAACTPKGPESPHTRISSLDRLRAAFNADSGKVRAIFLASPT
jgi:hypothetical protein